MIDKDLYHAVFETASEAMLLVQDGRFIEANASALALFECSRAELIGQPLQKLSPAIQPDSRDSAQAFQAQIEAAASGEEKRFEWLFRRPSNETFDAQVILKRLDAPASDEPMILISVRDISERKQTTAGLLESRQRYKDLVDNLPVGVYRNTPGPEGRFLEANPAIIAMFEAESREEFLQHNVSDLYQNPARRQELSQKLLEFGYIREEELKLKTLKGRSLWGAVTAIMKKDPTGQVYFDGIIEDISERKQAEEARRESEQRFRELFENSPDAIFVEDLDGNVLDVNPAACRLHEMERGELVGKNVLDLVPPTERETVARNFPKLVRGEWDHAEGFSWTADGQAVPVEVRASRIEYSGRPAILLHVRDITERKQAQEQLQFQKSLLESQSEAAIDGILVVSREREWLSFNRRFVEMWDIPPEVTEGRSLEAARQVIMDRVVDPQAFLTKVNYLYQHIDEESRDEIVLKDGRIFDRYSAPVKSPEGVYYGRVWYYRDITEQAKIESELQRAGDFLNKSIDAIPDPIFVKDEQHCWVVVNRAFCEVMGRTRDELLGKTDYDFFPKEEADLSWERDNLVFGTGIEAEQEETLTDASGQTRIISTKKSVFEDAFGRKLLVGVIRDITDIKATQEAIQRRARREQTIRQITEKMRAATSLEQLVRTTAEELGAQLSAGHAIVEMGVDSTDG
ncbi:MAG: PAS domain S-box protein [Anaerolineae bacterium]